MTTTLQIDVHLDAGAWRDDQAAAARRSLADRPPHLAPVWFYDEHGSDLFDQITRLPEYYPTRTERDLLIRHADELAALGADTLVELGSGTSDKTTTLLDAMVAAGSLRTYVPFDVSEETLRQAADQLAHRYPSTDIHGIVGDFHHHLGTVPSGDARMIAFLGSTIGNLDPAERARFLGGIAAAMGPDDTFLLGLDLVKDTSTLLAAYDDAAGVTAAFNRNALRVLNDELGCDFDVDGFHHEARWNPADSWIEMHLVADGHQRVTVPGLDRPVEIADGRSIRTEISTKFTVDGMGDELAAAGLEVSRACVAPDDAFALLLATPRR